MSNHRLDNLNDLVRQALEAADLLLEAATRAVTNGLDHLQAAEEALRNADFEAAAQQLSVSVEALQAALGAPNPQRP